MTWLKPYPANITISISWSQSNPTFFLWIARLSSARLLAYLFLPRTPKLSTKNYFPSNALVIPSFPLQQSAQARTHTVQPADTRLESTVGCQSGALLHLSSVSLLNPCTTAAMHPSQRGALELSTCLATHAQTNCDGYTSMCHLRAEDPVKSAWLKTKAEGFKKTTINIYAAVKRFPHFGACEDAEWRRESWLWHESSCNTLVTWQAHAPTAAPEDWSHALTTTTITTTVM